MILENQFGETSINALMGGLVYCSFVVDSANANGLGIKSLQGQGIKNVFMHTSQTPAVGSPNPAVGYILVELNQPYASFVGMQASLASPNSGSSINVTTGVTAGLAYVITALGTTTTAQWQVLGVPAGVTPAVGVAFIAPATTTATGTGTIQVNLATGSTTSHIEAVGNPSQTAMTTDGSGSSLVLVALAPTSSSVTTFKVLAPADGTAINLAIQMGN
jgi:hypothetical protein